ncbi:LuxR family transcriptional regulator [Streptomyces justiciae]|uniref:LuxR family transcriptional regulator n=1 Tax=Streptomyces justiciae TaxID=2780140 RepID=A0ABU3LKT6_9ACTN|nr:LuxR family transcriptional regulator [Streptomyces justiciae]MDT7839864.1 LuxR family transcriptional regulator [Streptomyces justiciae]
MSGGGRERDFMDFGGISGFDDFGAGQEDGPALLGRERELSRIARLIDAADGDGPRVLVLTGEPGAGKSALIDRAAAQARELGRRVLRVRGCEGEQDLGFAGVHQLLRPVLGGVDRLPAHQRDALRHALGMDPAGGATAPDPLTIRAAMLALLLDAAAQQPLLIAVDDAQWLDVGSLDVLAFAARRLDGEPAVLLLAAREAAVPARFDRDFPHLTAGPLDRAAAGRLLDAQPQPPTGRMRSRILAEAAGNPLALIELTRAFARDPGGAPPVTDRALGAADALPLTARLENLFAADLPALPVATRRALLLAAAAGTAQLSDVPDAGDPEVWAPAEQAGLVRVEGGQVRLRHPLVRSAVHQAATFTERRAAHLTLAAALAHEPDRRAWHLAAAALGPDEEIANALAESARRFRHRGGHAAAATALERAAELTPDPGERARRLLAAAESAMYAGHPQWVGEIAGRVTTLTDDPQLLAEASLRAGWSLAVTLRHDDALAFLIPVAESMATPAPALALSALGTAATPAYNSGDPRHRHDIQRIDGLVAPQPDGTDRVWTRAATQPFTDRPQQLKHLAAAVDTLPDDSERTLPGLVTLGGAAWILDETEEAVRLLGRARDHLRSAATAGANCTVAQALALAHFESGSWDAAQAAAEEAFWMATEAGADNVAVGSPILRATLRAARGDHAGARAQVADAVRGRDLRTSRSLYVRHRHALALAATAEGDHETAYGQLRATFTDEARPAPVHYHASLYHLADLAAAAVRAGRADDARAVLDAVRRTLEQPRSARLAAIVHRASALLSELEDAEPHFRAATEDPAAARWPFELALARLDFAEWLRRRRRTAEARPHLTAAHDTFVRLDARPWTERAAAELRAAGVTLAPADADAVADLTPQELQIARLAAEGLTNRDIGTRLYLSPRTVGYHLHKIFPKLGVTVRAQLRDALGRLPDSD